MSSPNTTVPVRCPACGEQTHKTLETILQDRRFICVCGASTELDLDEFAQEIRRCNARIKDFGRDG